MLNIKTKFGVSLFLIFVIFAFILSLLPVSAESREVVRIDDASKKDTPVMTMNNIEFYSMEKFYDYLLENYSVERSRGVPSFVAGTQWLFNSTLDFSSLSSSAPSGITSYWCYRNYASNDFWFETSSISYYNMFMNWSTGVWRFRNASGNYDCYSSGSWDSNSTRLISFTNEPNYFTWYNSGVAPSSLFYTWVYSNAIQVFSTFNASWTSTGGTITVSDGTTTTGNSPLAFESGSSLILTLTPSVGYDYPSDISVVGSYGSLQSSGSNQWVITECASDLTITVTFRALPTFTASIYTTNGRGTLSGGGSVSDSITFTYGDNIYVVVQSDDGYSVPSSITVTGTYASVTPQRNLGTWLISNCRSNITVSVDCVEIIYVSVDLNFTDCTLSYNQTVSGDVFSATVIPNDGFTYPVSVTGHSAGLPLSISYNSLTGQLTIVDCPSSIVLYASAISISSDNTITYNLTNITCSINQSTVASGSVLSFTLTPLPGYLISEGDTSVMQGGSGELVIYIDNSYNFSYSFTVIGDVTITGVAIPWRTALSNAYNQGYINGGSGSGGSGGDYRTGYNDGFTAGVDAVAPDSLDSVALSRYDQIYSNAYLAGISSVNSSASGEALSAYQRIYNTAFNLGVTSVTDSAVQGSLSFSQWQTIFNSGISSVSHNSDLGTASRVRYDDIYNMAYTNGLHAGENEGVSEALTGFIPSVIASIGGGLLYTGEHISVFGVSLLSIVGILALLAIGLWIFKLFKGSL